MTSGKRQIFGNIAWLLSDRAVRMGVGLLVGIWVARYLGPGDFGLLNFSLALVALFTTVAGLGLNDVVVRDLLRQPEQDGEILGTAMALQAVGGAIAFALAVATVMVLRPADPAAWAVTALCALALLGQCGDTIRSLFEARVLSRNVVIVANATFGVITIGRIAGIVTGQPLPWFAFLSGIEMLLTTVALMVMVRRSRGPAATGKWRATRERAVRLLRVSWPLALSGIAIILNMRIDQVMLGQMLGDDAVGLFSAAVRVSEVWYFIPVAIVASVFPAIARETDTVRQARRWQQLYAAMLWISVAAAVFATVFGDLVIRLLYGASFAAAGQVLVIHIWSGVNVALGLVWSRWIILENRPRLALLVQSMGAVLNIGLNLILIPRYGILGAALATLASYWISGLLSYAIHKPRVTLGYLLPALTPWRLLKS